MSSPYPNRTLPRLGVVTAAVVLGAATLGCGVIRQVGQTVDNLSAVADLADKLDRSKNLTYTADYEVADGSKITVSQQPPNSSFASTKGRIITTEQDLIFCSGERNPVTCQRRPNTTGTFSGEDTAFMATFAGEGFVSADMAFTITTAASVIPGVKVTKSTRKIAGQPSTCLKVTNIPTDSNGGGDSGGTTVRDFTACVADNGLLTSFKGTNTAGHEAGVELMKYRGSVDASAFVPPPGAEVTDVERLFEPDPGQPDPDPSPAR